MAENGEEKLLAVARHIAKTLGDNDSTADDILQIFSKFDGRFSREKLSSHKMMPDAAAADPRSSVAALDLALKALHRRISQYVAADYPIWSDSADSSAFLDVVDELHATIRDWSRAAAEKPVRACLDRAEDLLQQAMFRLEDEFRLLMERGGESLELSRSAGKLSFDSEEEEEEDDGDRMIPVAQPVTDYGIVIDALPSGTVSDLQEIAKRMVAAGFGKECSHVYGSCRREFLEESFSRLGLQKLSIEEVQRMAWSELEDEIERWIKAANAALRIFYPSERRLCDRVFSGFCAAADLSFMEVCRGSTIQLLNFANAMAIGSRNPERLFKILDLFETVRDLMPEVETMFADRHCLFLRNEAMAIWKRLGEAIRGIFMELENLISRDPAKAPVPGGRVHPITRYVMNYLVAACRSRQTLEQIFDEGVELCSNYRNPDNRASSSSLSVQMAWIMELLETNLEAKSRTYRDPALCSIFLMNNERYIVQKAKDAELGTLLGDDWVRKHTAKVRQYVLNYQRSSWSKAVAVLKGEAAGLLAPAPVPKNMTVGERLNLFNSYFEENCKVQCTWVIADEQLREDVRKSVTGNLLPAYRNFLVRLQGAPSEAGKQIDKSFRWFRPDEVETRIGDLFRGSNGGGKK